MRDKLTKLLATFFYTGYFPVAPGSLATIAGALLSIIFSVNLAGYILAFFMVTIAGFLASDRMEKIAQQKDPSCIVIDEVAGSFIAFFMLPLNIPVWITAFFLFRAFDMFKIYPINKLENLRGGVGVMSDDLLAGLYTNVTMHLALTWLGVYKLGR